MVCMIIPKIKVNASEHDSQLVQYKKIIEDEYGKNIRLGCIYLKTGV